MNVKTESGLSGETKMFNHVPKLIVNKLIEAGTGDPCGTLTVDEKYLIETYRSDPSVYYKVKIMKDNPNKFRLQDMETIIRVPQNYYRAFINYFNNRWPTTDKPTQLSLIEKLGFLKITQFFK